jgi:hypothetical protein
VVTLAILWFWSTNPLNAADKLTAVGATTEPPTIAEIMKITHKKPRQLLKQVAIGKANAAEKQELLKLYQALAASNPPKGDADSWAMKTKLLVAAAEAAVKNEKGADEMLQRAADCTACHQAHK